MDLQVGSNNNNKKKKNTPFRLKPFGLKAPCLGSWCPRIKASSLLVSGRQLSARSLVRRFLGTRRCFAFAGTSLLQGGSWLDRRRDGAILAAAKLNEQTELLGRLIERGEKRYCLLLLQDLLEVVSQPPHRILLEIYSRLHAELTGEPETLDPEVDD